MATTHTCSFDIRCRKQHTCVGCGGQFSYVFARKITGSGATPEAAAAAAEKVAQQQIESSVDNHPCPTCGLYQPDMIGARRAKWQGWLWGASMLAVVLLFILSVAHVLQDDAFVPTALVIFGTIGVIQLLVDLRQPNRDLESNRMAAQRLVEAGVLRKDTPGQSMPSLQEPWQARGSLLGPVAFVLFLVSLACIMSPTLLRQLRGWPFNPTCYPGVIGPGDSTCFYMDQSISSVKGYFRANAEVTARTKDNQVVRFNAKSNQSNWGDSISVKSSEKNSSKRLWVTLDVPDQKELAGQEFDCQIKLDTQYPKIRGTDTFEVENRTFNGRVPMKLGPPRCGAAYHSLWWWGTLGGMALFLVSGGLRVRGAGQLKKQALPTSVSTLGEGGN
jgi:hypothetical protein